MTACSVLCLPLHSCFSEFRSLSLHIHGPRHYPSNSIIPLLPTTNRSPLESPRLKATTTTTTITSSMEAKETVANTTSGTNSNAPMKLLFVEMGVGYDQHGQDVTAAAMRACRDAISSNSIPAFRRGSIPGVTFDQMKLQIKLGVPHSLQQSLDIERVKSVFPYGKIVNVEVVDGGLICSSGVYVEEMGDKNDDCYIVNAAVYIGTLQGNHGWWFFSTTLLKRSSDAVGRNVDKA